VVRRGNYYIMYLSRGLGAWASISVNRALSLGLDWTELYKRLAGWTENNDILLIDGLAYVIGHRGQVRDPFLFDQIYNHIYVYDGPAIGRLVSILPGFQYSGVDWDAFGELLLDQEDKMYLYFSKSRGVETEIHEYKLKHRELKPQPIATYLVSYAEPGDLMKNLSYVTPRKFGLPIPSWGYRVLLEFITDTAGVLTVRADVTGNFDFRDWKTFDAAVGTNYFSFDAEAAGIDMYFSVSAVLTVKASLTPL